RECEKDINNYKQVTKETPNLLMYDVTKHIISLGDLCLVEQDYITALKCFERGILTIKRYSDDPSSLMDHDLLRRCEWGAAKTLSERGLVFYAQLLFDDWIRGVLRKREGCRRRLGLGYEGPVETTKPNN